jgi:hypothetical protein
MDLSLQITLPSFKVIKGYNSDPRSTAALFVTIRSIHRQTHGVIIEGVFGGGVMSSFGPECVKTKNREISGARH